MAVAAGIGLRRPTSWRGRGRGVRKPCKLATHPALRAIVAEKLKQQQWSPQQIAGWLKTTYPDDPEMQVSHETIYRTLFIQSRGALRKELTAHLRTGRARRWRGVGVGCVVRTMCDGHAHLRMRAASVASVAAIAAVLPPVLTAVAATVHPVGDDDRPADGGGGTAPASCCQWHVSLLPSFPRTTRLRRQPRRRR